MPAHFAFLAWIFVTPNLFSRLADRKWHLQVWFPAQPVYKTQWGARRHKAVAVQPHAWRCYPKAGPTILLPTQLSPELPALYSPGASAGAPSASRRVRRQPGQGAVTPKLLQHSTQHEEAG